jgi:hypothetical protein
MNKLPLPLLLFLPSFLLLSCRTLPLGTGFDEPSDPDPAPHAAWQAVEPGLHAAFGSIDQRYAHRQPPPGPGGDTWRGTAWRGERVNIQLMLWSREPARAIMVGMTPLEGPDGATIDAMGVYPVRYVLTDIFADGCGARAKDALPVHLAADMLAPNQRFNLLADSLRPVWLTIDVPADAAPGVYSGMVRVAWRDGALELPLTLQVRDLVLPPPAEWSFHLDLWQNPFAVARYHGVKPWSEAHWQLLPPYLEMLAAAGQKCITASILHKPWGGQTHDPFDSMITWVHAGADQWEFDYAIFDRWVELAMDCGIDRQINCYSMVPWGNQVRYFDRPTGGHVTVTLQPGSEEYAAIWTPFLKSFREHLRAKGWLERTLIAMDERAIDEMRGMVGLLKRVAPELKIALAGNYMAELNDDLHDLCVFIVPQIDPELIAARVERGMPTTFYTCCLAPESPNNFTFSPPAEQAWMGWHAAARGYSGYLRWAYNSWVADPIRDSRFRTWPAGDTYQIYPGPSSSIRFERLREGIQDYEKIRIVRALLAQRGEPERLAELERILGYCMVEELLLQPADHWLNQGKRELDALAAWLAGSAPF